MSDLLTKGKFETPVDRARVAADVQREFDRPVGFSELQPDVGELCRQRQTELTVERFERRGRTERHAVEPDLAAGFRGYLSALANGGDAGPAGLGEALGVPWDELGRRFRAWVLSD